jgi:hypothetical protein
MCHGGISKRPLPSAALVCLFLRYPMRWGSERLPSDEFAIGFATPDLHHGSPIL